MKLVPFKGLQPVWAVVVPGQCWAQSYLSHTSACRARDRVQGAVLCRVRYEILDGTGKPGQDTSYET